MRCCLSRSISRSLFLESVNELKRKMLWKTSEVCSVGQCGQPAAQTTDPSGNVSPPHQGPPVIHQVPRYLPPTHLPPFPPLSGHQTPRLQGSRSVWARSGRNFDPLFKLGFHFSWRGQKHVTRFRLEVSGEKNLLKSPHQYAHHTDNNV